MADASVAPPPQMTSPDPPSPPVPGPEEPNRPSEPKVDVPKADKWPFAEAQPIREDQVRNAVNFLKHPKVQGTPIVHRRSFLERKGLTREEIDEAFRRCPDPPSNEAAKAQVLTEGKDANPASVQGQAGGVYQAIAPPQPQPQTLQPYTNVPSSAVVSARSGPHWSQLVIGASLIAATGAGTGYLFQKVLAFKFRAWLRELLREEKELPDSGSEALGKIKKLTPLEEAVGAAAVAANAAASAATEMANTTRDVLKSQAEGNCKWQQLKSSIKSLENQSEELKTTLLTMSQKLQQTDEPVSFGLYKGPVNSSQQISVPVEQVQPRQGFQNLKVGNRVDKAQSNGHSTTFNTYVEEEQPRWHYKKSEVETFASTKQPADISTSIDAELNQEIGSSRPRTLGGEAQSRGGPLGRQGWVPPAAPRTVMPGAASAIRYQKPATMVDEVKPTVVSEEKVVDSEASFEQVSSSVLLDKRSAYPDEKEMDLQGSYEPPKMPEVSEMVEVTSVDKEIAASKAIGEASEVNGNDF